MEKHHIVPKHMGGIDHPLNIMELSREDHGWAHLILHKLYGHKEDLWAAHLLLESRFVDQTGDNNPARTPEARAKLSAGKMGDKNPMKRPEVAAKTSATLKKKIKEDPVYRAKIVAAAAKGGQAAARNRRKNDPK